MKTRRKRKLISYRQRKALLKKKIIVGTLVMGATFFVCLRGFILTTSGKTTDTSEYTPSETQIIMSDNNDPSENLNASLGCNIDSNKNGDTYKNESIKNDVIETTEIKEGSGDSMIPPTDFSDSAFIGDSRTEGLAMFTDLSKASLFYSKGLTVTRARTDKTIKLTNGSMGTVLDGLKEKEFKRIYIMFGINELGWPSTDAFIRDYTRLIEDIKSIQPNATIFIQSVLPVEASRSNNDPLYNNNNIVRFNNGIKEMTEKLGIEYVDVSSAISDESGALPAGVSHDGIHPNKNICQRWLNYLIQTTSTTRRK